VRGDGERETHVHTRGIRLDRGIDEFAELGERLDLPASAITEAVIDERLRGRGVSDDVLKPLHELFQTCNAARYAPTHSSQELTALIPKLEGVLRALQRLKA